MRGLLKYYGIKRVYILGAGFSRPAGLPLTNELIKLIHGKSSTKPWYLGNNQMAEWGQADWLVEELRHFYPTIRINHKRIIENKLRIDIEEFLSYIAASSAFIENTGEKWDDHGSKFQSWIKKWLAEVIYEYQKKIAFENLELYENFAKNLKKSIVITFNWDTILENTFEKLGIPFSYDLNSAVESKSVALIKMHGSIDWFKPHNYDYKRLGKANFSPLCKSISEIYRYNSDLQECFANYLTPYIVTPNFDKLSQLKAFGDLWTMPWIYLQDELEVSVIGFSMRQDDFHTRAFIYPQLVYGTKKNKIRIKVIDYADDHKQQRKIQKKYKGIKNVQYSFNGFNKETLKWLNK